MKKGEPGQLRQDSGHHRRILLTALLFGVLAFLPLLWQYGKLMLGEYRRYAELALKNQSRSTSVQAARGIIYDCNGTVLAASWVVENIYLDPRELKQSKADLDSLSRALGEILERDADWILDQAKDSSKRYKQIGASVDEETADRVREYINKHGIFGVHLEPGIQRVYPQGSLAAQVIGFVNKSGEGCEGIESSYDSFLTGEKGRVITTKGNNEMDMPFSYESFVQPEDGCSLILTIDTVVQSCLEKQMEEAIARYDVQNGAFGMVMNAKTGEILAMATLGSFDPNAYQEIADGKAAAELQAMAEVYQKLPEGSEAYRAAKADYEAALQAARLKQWRNRCISDGYEPGSTFKLITMSAALDCGAIDLNTNYYCRGSERIPGRAQLLHCWRSAGHGAEQTPQALQNSCNIAFAHIALKLGGEQFYDYVSRFGVLEKTGIDLQGESKGVFFDKSLVIDTDKWGTASLTSGSFGQTFKLTPLQLVRAVAAVVNGGKLLEPYVVSEVIDARGNTVLKQEPTVIRQVISEETSLTMRSLMQSVVEVGTAKNAQVAGYSVGGKTGTSEKIDVFDENGNRVLDKIVSFVGVAPMEDPEYVVLVALDTPSRSTGIYISGGVMGAPTVGGVLGDILPYLGAQKKEEPEQVEVPELVGQTLQYGKKALSDLELEAVVKGEGTVITAQLPVGGMTAAKGTQVMLYLETESTAVTVPDLLGLPKAEAELAALEAGLVLQSSGNGDYSENNLAVSQSPEAGAILPWGSEIEVEFGDRTPEG